jgi:signal transduction histidine kinase
MRTPRLTLMGWAGRIFDRRDGWIRFLLLDLSGIGFLVFGADDGHHTTPGQWVLAIIAFTAGPALSRWPEVGMLTQATLLGIALCVLDDPTINQVGASWALLELTVWAGRLRTVWLGAGLLVAVYLFLDIVWSPNPLVNSTFGLVVPIGLPLLLGLFIRTSTELARQAEQRAVAERQRQESESRAARADERGAIARELHDVVAHHVASMVLRVGVARHVVPGLDPRLAAVLDDVHSTGTAALADLRQLVEVLRDPAGVRGDAALTAIDPGALPAALGAAVDNARRTGLIVDADIDAAVGTIDAVRGMAVLRLTQEALTNVAKHAGVPARCRLRVAVADGQITWEVSDDGGSAPPAAVPPGGGHGLTGMRERVEVLGGRLTAGPSGTGWRVRTVLPAQVAAA